MKNEVAIVLGGTFPHRRLLNNLKRRGYHTILVDYLEHPCAAECADEHIRESTLNVAKVQEIARTRKASLVISSCIDQANLVACEVSENLGLPHPYNTNTAKIVTNKPLMKELMVKHGIPTARFSIIRSVDLSLAETLGYPLIVKPADSNSSKGVRKVDSLEEFQDAVSEAIDLSRTKEVVVEKFIEGKEIGIDCFVHETNVSILATRFRRKMSVSHGAQQITGSIWPAGLSNSELEDISRVANMIARALGLKNCPLLIQAIVKDGAVSVIEFAARFGGGENYSIIQSMIDVDILDLSIKSFLGEKVELDFRKNGLVYSDVYLYANSGVLGGVSLPELGGAIVASNTYKNIGFVSNGSVSSNNRIGAIVVKGETPQEALMSIKLALEKVSIKDNQGNNIFHREMYKDIHIL